MLPRPDNRPPRPVVELPAEPVTVTTADGVPLRGLCAGGPATHTFVIGHGMSHSTAEPSTRAVIGWFARHGTVLALDFRGHGASGGLSSVGGDEVLDIDAAVGLARSMAMAPVTTVGFSMGGTVVLRQAALGGNRPDVVIAVSSPSRWFLRESVPMRRVHWMVEHPLGPWVGRRAGIRVGPAWDEVPPTPLETISRITQPLLLVQGTADRYFSAAQAIDLQRASLGHAELWLEPGHGPRGIRHVGGVDRPDGPLGNRAPDGAAAWRYRRVRSPPPTRADPADNAAAFDRRLPPR